MAFNTQQGGFEPKKMYDVDTVCSKCGTKIDRLPFEPDPNRMNQVLCKDCYRARAQSFRR